MRFQDIPLCVDARMVGQNGTGVTTYAQALVEAVRTIHPRPFLLSASRSDDDPVRKVVGALSLSAPQVACDRNAVLDAPGVLVARDIFRRAHVHFTLYRRVMELRPPFPFGVMHWTYPVPLRMAGWLNIYTVHDLIPLLQPELSPVRSSRHRRIMRLLRKSGDPIVTVSEAARADILSTLELAPSRVTNCGQGVAFTASGENPDAVAALPKGRYFLFCGAIEPRKNLARLVEAYRASGVAEPLVLAGPDGWRSESINRLARDTPGVIRLGYLHRSELLWLIQHARALLFPSLVEGFGLPVIEAMQAGTPVLTSAIGALAEVAGDAGVLVDPLNVGQMADGISALSFDDELVADLTERGLLRALAFSPARFAEKLEAVYQQAVATYSQQRT
jgi:glycosyltransferase involved in cell wall biosynthesis